MWLSQTTSPKTQAGGNNSHPGYSAPYRANGLHSHCAFSSRRIFWVKRCSFFRDNYEGLNFYLECVSSFTSFGTLLFRLSPPRARCDAVPRPPGRSRAWSVQCTTGSCFLERRGDFAGPQSEELYVDKPGARVYQVVRTANVDAERSSANGSSCAMFVDERLALLVHCLCAIQPFSYGFELWHW